jgi:hypothetical protein
MQFLQEYRITTTDAGGARVKLLMCVQSMKFEQVNVNITANGKWIGYGDLSCSVFIRSRRHSNHQ